MIAILVATEEKGDCRRENFKREIIIEMDMWNIEHMSVQPLVTVIVQYTVRPVNPSLSVKYIVHNTNRNSPGLAHSQNCKGLFYYYLTVVRLNYLPAMPPIRIYKNLYM